MGYKTPPSCFIHQEPVRRATNGGAAECSAVQLCASLGCPPTSSVKRGSPGWGPHSLAATIYSRGALASCSCFAEKVKFPGTDTSEKPTCMLLSHCALPSSRESRTALLGSSAAESFPLTT